jgi:neutral ceramidase
MCSKVSWVIVGLLAWTNWAAGSPGWRAGVARTRITPATPLWMAGYTGRARPAETPVTDLWLKALALVDENGHTGVVVTCDIIGLKHPLYQSITSKLTRRFGLRRDQVVLCPSHTHCGPLLRGYSRDSYPLTAAQDALVEAYSDELGTKAIETVGNALADLDPARLSGGQGQTGFAVNRRNNAEGRVEEFISNHALAGPIDHSVPVLAVHSPDGKLKAVLFGYACHNTTMDFYQWCADYAGFAQTALEHSHPEATAMFFMGCGADQNPLPRRRLELAERYGQMLAAAVEEVLLQPPSRTPPKLNTSIAVLTLPFGPAPTTPELEKLTLDPTPAIQRWATRLLQEKRAGQTWSRDYPYPIQVWRLGDQLVVWLAGEPVVDYALRLKHDLGGSTWVAGYCNEVMTYIPSTRVLREDRPPLASPRWGYEGSRAFMAAGFPAYQWGDKTEVLISRTVRKLARQVLNE